MSDSSLYTGLFPMLSSISVFHQQGTFWIDSVGFVSFLLLLPAIFYFMIKSFAC